MIRISPRWKRFSTYVLVGAGTFLFDMALLYSAVSLFNISYIVATPAAFLVAVSLNYVISRRYVFRGTERKLHTGYYRFAGAALLGAGATTLIVTGMVQYLQLNYLVARVLTSMLIGIGNYLYNLHINFNVAGLHVPFRQHREGD